MHRSALSLMFFDNLVGVGGEYVEKVESVYMVKCVVRAARAYEVPTRSRWQSRNRIGVSQGPPQLAEGMKFRHAV